MIRPLVNILVFCMLSTLVLPACDKFPAIKDHASLPVAEVKNGEFKLILRQVGEVQAVNSTLITPKSRGEIANLAPEGSYIEQGQPVAWLETSDLEKALDRKKAALEVANLQLRKVKEDSALAEKTSAMAIEEAQATFEFRKNQLEDAERNLEKAIRMVEAKLAPQKSIEEAQLRKRSEELQVENARIALEKANYQRGSQLELNRVEINNRTIEVERAQVEFDNAQDELTKAVIKAPTSGILLYERTWQGSTLEKVRVGSPVGPWSAILQIPDLTQLQIETAVDEIDIALLKPDLQALIQFEAFPDLTLAGKVSKIASLAKELGQDAGWNQEKQASGRKVFDVFISLEQTDPRLRPGLTSTVEVIIEHRPSAILAPLESVFRRDGQAFVYLKTAGEPRKTLIKTGTANEQEICIEDGLTEGQQVYLVDPTLAESSAG